MFSKLALNNVKKSMKDYTIYFLTLMFGVCLFYVFNSIESQQAMLILSSSQKALVKELVRMIGMVSIFISVILGLLIVYANRFLIKRRKKELGIYMLLGMEKHKISHILILETLNIGIIALAVGLAVGILASQGLAVFTAKMFHTQMNEFKFIFSPSAFIKSILYFGIIFIIVMIFNTITISKFKLIDLLIAARKNETLNVKKLWLSVLLFLISVITLSIAYYLIIENGLLKVNLVFWSSIILGTIGTFLFFLSLSGFLLRIVQSNKKIYFKGLNMFVLRQINSKITTTFISMTLICLMLLLAIGILSSGAGIARTFNIDLEKVTPYDLSLSNIKDDGSTFDNSIDLVDKMKEDGMEWKELISNYTVLPVYHLDITTDKILKYYMETAPKDFDDFWGQVTKMQVEFIPLSKYNDALKLQGKSPIILKDNELAFSCNFKEVHWNYEKYIKNKDTLTINSKEFTIYPKVLEVSYYTTITAQDFGTVIIPDKEVAKGTLVGCYNDIKFTGDAEETSQIVHDKMDLLYLNKEKPFRTSMFKAQVYEQSAGISTIVSYLAIYIGAIFLITCSAVLALQQLSESSDNMERYKLLRKIGVEEKEINKSVFQQIFIYFMMPLSLAIVHSFVGVSVANNVIKMLGHIDAAAGIIASGIGILLIYGGYMIATYFGCKSMIRSK